MYHIHAQIQYNEVVVAAVVVYSCLVTKLVKAAMSVHDAEINLSGARGTAERDANVTDERDASGTKIRDSCGREHHGHVACGSHSCPGFTVSCQRFLLHGRKLCPLFKAYFSQLRGSDKYCKNVAFVFVFSGHFFQRHFLQSFTYYKLSCALLVHFTLDDLGIESRSLGSQKNKTAFKNKNKFLATSNPIKVKLCEILKCINKGHHKVHFHKWFA